MKSIGCWVNNNPMVNVEYTDKFQNKLTNGSLSVISLRFSLAQICKSLDLLSVVGFVRITNYGIENKAINSSITQRKHRVGVTFHLKEIQ